MGFVIGQYDDYIQKIITNRKAMNKEKKLSIMGVGSYNLDTIVKREYPEGFVPGKRNKFVEKVMIEEIGSNPGNVMCILGWFG